MFDESFQSKSRHNNIARGFIGYISLEMTYSYNKYKHNTSDFSIPLLHDAHILLR